MCNVAGNVDPLSQLNVWLPKESQLGGEFPMMEDGMEDWSVGQIVGVPHSWRGDGLWAEIQLEAHDRIGADLRETYAELVQQPLSPSLVSLVQQIEAQLGTLAHNG